MKPRYRNYVKFGKIIHALRGAGRRLNHRRISMFWAVAAVSLTLPWVIVSGSLPVADAGDTYDACAVLSIHDGDTMTVNCAGRKMRVRLYCIDAPEMAQKPWGRQSRDYLRKITPPEVQLVEHGHDRYGRTVAEVFAGTRNLNLEQVKSGRAAEYGAYCHERAYRQAAASARSSRAGIWSVSGQQQAPWEYRHR